MDLSELNALHPTFDDTSNMLLLELHHGKANEMGRAELSAFEALCNLIDTNKSIRSLCVSSRRVSSKGTPIFIAGANVTERSDWSRSDITAHVERQRRLMVRLGQLPIFTVGVTHGATLGWGVEFLLTTDYVIATPTASMALPETGLGIVPGAGGTANLAAAIGPAHALRLGCTGETIDAHEAYRVGLVHEVADDVDTAMTRVHTLAALTNRRSPTAVAAYKRALVGGIGHPDSPRLELEQAAYNSCLEHGDAKIGRDHFKSIRLGQRPPWPERE